MSLGALRHFWRDDRGNIAIVFALSMLPAIGLIGAAVDYSLASMRRSQLSTIADSAALAALTPTLLAENDAASVNAATTLFNSQIAGIRGIGSVDLTVTPSDSGLTRTVTVQYQTTSPTIFGSFIGMKAVTLSGASTASATVPPNIDFYLLLDNSPSMNIAATTAGINTMVANTQSQGGCAFACHESNPSQDNLGNAGGVDNYTLAAQLGVVTRIQNMATATQALMSTATSTMAQNNASYRMAIYTFNYQGTTTVQPLTSSMSTAATAAAGINVVEVYANNWLTSTNMNNDEDTNFESAMSNISSIMPAPGTGTANSTPQEVLFIVSDGVDDNTSVSCSQPLDGARCQQPFNTSMCTTIKNSGIRIAVLYTVYLPLPTNSWYNDWIAPFQSQISPNMQSCASPGLFFSVTTDGDITAAMQQLFLAAVQTAHLTQ